MAHHVRNQRRFVGATRLFNKANSHYKRRDHRWAIILAGGDGTRLRSLTRAIAGDERPKQFCPILSNETLLDQTRRRVSLLIPSKQTLLSLTETHRDFYQPLLNEFPAQNLVIQPSNLGTAPAILYSLLRLEQLDRRAIVAFFPSDHYLSNNQIFMAHVGSAFRAVRVEPEMIVLLGIEPDRPETEYGWIEPSLSILDSLPKAIRRVTRFWEKPSLTVATKLMEQGFLWNSFVMVGQVSRFLHLIRNAVPDLFAAFVSVKPVLATQEESAAIRKLYSEIPPINFSDVVLARSANKLAVMAVKDVTWSDWGDPSRVLSTLAQIGIATYWAEEAG